MSKRIDARHWKLSEDAMALFLAQADIRLATLSYTQLAERTGMTANSVRVTMWNILREKRAGKPRVHRGTSEKQSIDQLAREHM